MKRVVSSSIITLLIIIAAAATFIYLKKFRSGSGDVTRSIPADASFFLVYSHNDAFPGSVKGSAFWKVLQQVPALKNLKQQIGFIDSLCKADAGFKNLLAKEKNYFSAHVTGAEEFDFLMLKNLPESIDENSVVALLSRVSGGGESTPDSRNYDGVRIYELAGSDKKAFHFCINKGIFIGSFTSFLVEDAIRQMKIGKPLTDDFKFAGESPKEGILEAYVNTRTFPTFLSVFLKQDNYPVLKNMSRIAGWSFSKLTVTSGALSFNGIFNNPDSSDIINCLNSQQPVEKKLLQILPKRTACIYYTGMSDFSAYYERFRTHYLNAEEQSVRAVYFKETGQKYKWKPEERMLSWIGNEIALVITEPSGVNYESSAFAVLKAKKINEAINILKTISRIIDKQDDTKTKEELYNGHVIGLIRLNNFPEMLLGPQYAAVSRMYYTNIGSYIVIGNQASSLRSFIDDFESKSLLVKEPAFTSAEERMNTKGNLFFYMNPSASYYLLQPYFKTQQAKSRFNEKALLAGIGYVYFQVTAGAEKCTLEGAAGMADETKSDGVDRIFTFETDSSVSMTPFVSTDSETGDRRFLVQDDAENLYLINSGGELLWKINIQGRILGEVSEVDLFRNKSRQFLFNTKDYLYLLDEEGKPVGNYPIRLPAPATNGIAVLDFEKNNDPRIYVACSNNRVYAYLLSGKPMPGWNFSITTGLVSSPVNGITIKGKPYLLISDESGGVSLVNRYGESGILVSGGFAIASNSSVSQDSSGNIYTSDRNGNAMVINPDGNIASHPSGEKHAEHGFYATDVNQDGAIDFVFADGNELVAYRSDMKEIFRKEFDEVITGRIIPGIFKDGRKVLLVQSETSNKLWMVYTDGSIVNGFPVKGKSPVLYSDPSGTGKKILVTGSTDPHIFVYSLN